MSQDKSVRPALENLHSEQKEFVETCLGGVGSLQAQLELLHDWVVLSAGRVSSDQLHDVGATRIGMYSGVFLDSFEHQNVRANFVNQEVVPTLNAAHEELWQSATEYGEGGPNPEAEESVAMRPAIQELWEGQRAVLRRGVEGFDSMEEVAEWAHDVGKVTLGEADSDWLGDLTGPVTAQPFHFPPFDDNRNVRIVGSVKYLLPWFRDAIWLQVQSAAEQAGDKDADLTEYQLDENLVVDDTRDGGG